MHPQHCGAARQQRARRMHCTTTLQSTCVTHSKLRNYLHVTPFLMGVGLAPGRPPRQVGRKRRSSCPFARGARASSPLPGGARKALWGVRNAHPWSGRVIPADPNSWPLFVTWGPDPLGCSRASFRDPGLGPIHCIEGRRDSMQCMKPRRHFGACNRTLEKTN